MLLYSPLKDRVYRSHVSVAPKPVSLIGRSGKYKEWTEQQMEHALRAVVAGSLSVRLAALHYNVPRSTLGDRVSGRVIPGSTSGPPTYLTASEERELVQFLVRSASIGYAKSRKDVMAIVQRIMVSKGMTQTLSAGWWESFTHRHPNISLRTAAPLSLGQVKKRLNPRSAPGGASPSLSDAVITTGCAGVTSKRSE